MSRQSTSIVTSPGEWHVRLLGLSSTRLISKQRFADVAHEVRPMTSGYRMVLFYNLSNVFEGPSPSASVILGSRQGFLAILSSWDPATKKGNRQSLPSLIYQLDHQYTDTSLSFRALKGLDRVKAEYLRDTCCEAGICLYLASLQPQLGPAIQKAVVEAPVQTVVSWMPSLSVPASRRNPFRYRKVDVTICTRY